MKKENLSHILLHLILGLIIVTCVFVSMLYLIFRYLPENGLIIIFINVIAFVGIYFNTIQLYRKRLSHKEAKKLLTEVSGFIDSVRFIDGEEVDEDDLEGRVNHWLIKNKYENR